MEDTLTDKLISILKDRDLPVKQEVVESFEDDRNGDLINKELREWSSNFKSPLTTLSGVRSIFF
jgi:hypothetical protein